MPKKYRLVEQYLCEQVAMEEELCQLIVQQFCEIDKVAFPEVRQLLINAREVLEQHFVTLNRLLDQYEDAKRDVQGNLCPSSKLKLLAGGKVEQVSRILVEDHSLLNLISMGNTMLHTVALALDHGEAAAVALDHLQHVAPLVIKIGDLLPKVVTKELQSRWAKINPSISDMAATNLRTAWSSVGRDKQ